MSGDINDLIRQAAIGLDNLIMGELLQRISPYAVREARAQARARHPTMNPDAMTSVSLSGSYQEINGYVCTQAMRRPIWWLYLTPRDR